MRYKTESEIKEVIRNFEDATISRDEWKHAEHLTVALHYLCEQDLEAATEKIRTGISNLLGAFGVDLTKDMPYHETMTVFWMKTVARFNNVKQHNSLVEKANEIIRRYDKEYPLTFYSHDLLFSDLARAKFVEPDIMPLLDQ